METPELFMKSNVIPVYITPTNSVTPLLTINNLYTDTVQLLNIAANILQIVFQTITFIMKEIFAEVFTKMTLVKMIYIIGIYHLFILAVLDNHQRKIIKQKQQIETLEKQVRHLNLWTIKTPSCQCDISHKVTVTRSDRWCKKNK